MCVHLGGSISTKCMCATMSLQIVMTMYVLFVNSICSMYFELHTRRKELFSMYFELHTGMKEVEIEYRMMKLRMTTP